MADNPVPPERSPSPRVRRKTRAEREQEARYHFALRLAEIIARSVNNGVRWGCLLGISYFLYSSIQELAGKTTMADIGLKWLMDFGVADVFAVLFGGGGLLFGFRRWQLQRRNTAHLAQRVAEYERRIDPKRSSSALLDTGETRPEDDL